MMTRNPFSCCSAAVRGRRLLAAAAIAIAGSLAIDPGIASAQALQSLRSARVTYNTRKATTHPQGELRARIDEVDKAIAAAFQTGNTGEARRQIAKGLVLLAGDAWTPALDFQNSLVLRSERTVIDSSQPYALRLEQIYVPSIALSPAITARVALLKPEEPAPPPGTAPRMVLVREFGRFDGVARDLREAPFPIELDLGSMPDGAYTIEAEVFDAGTSLGAARLGVVLSKGVDARTKALDVGAAGVPEALRADVRYPADYIRNVNRGRVRLNTFDVAAELSSAEAILAAARKGKDPFAGRTGGMERHYVLQGADEVMPYRVYVPTHYAAARPVPLLIALHGLGGTEDAFFDGYSGVPVTLAEQHGFLMAAPLGYRVDGFYGAPAGGGQDAADARRLALSEQDVLEVVRLMREHYNVDPGRIYLMGHSMGAIGTWYLAGKYPGTWAALGLFAGTARPDLAERIRQIPQIVVHGDADPTVNVSGSRAMVAALRTLGADVTYIEVPGGEHTDVVVPNLPAVFDFLAAHRKGAR